MFLDPPCFELLRIRRRLRLENGGDECNRLGRTFARRALERLEDGSVSALLAPSADEGPGLLFLHAMPDEVGNATAPQHLRNARDALGGSSFSYCMGKGKGGIGPAFPRHSRGIGRFVIFQPPRLGLVRLTLAVSFDSIAFVSEAALLDVVIDDLEERHKGRLQSPPLSRGAAHNLGEKAVVIRQVASSRPPHGDEQKQVSPMLDCRQVGGVSDVGVSPQGKRGELCH